jgi:hypothetical protein
MKGMKRRYYYVVAEALREYELTTTSRAGS